MRKYFTNQLINLQSILAGGLAAALSGLSIEAANAQRVLWSDTPYLPIAAQRATQSLTHFRSVTFQLTAVQTALGPAPAEGTVAARSSGTVVSLPLPDGSSQRFRVVEVPVMHPQLAARYPNIRTYAAQGIDDPAATARLDVSPDGFHAMILAPGKTVYIDPATRGGQEHLVYERRSMNRSAFPFVCSTPASAGVASSEGLPTANRSALANGSTLRTYRLALACTGEYAAFHGGTREGAMAGMVASMNRVNGIYERELAIRMVLVAQNDQLIFLDPETDPYTNSSGSAMLNQNQTTVDARIGTANYDIGHVFSTGGGGVAQTPSVCITGKARGVTGQASPANDAFDVDFVAHEMGHQFGAEHTFNSDTGGCGGGNRSASSAYEPGSGTTIMAYAGICEADNIQPNSDPYFHSRSFDEIIGHITGRGSCATATATGNAAPAVNAGRNYAIPINTPFVLTGSATDANSDPLTYSWEQFDLGPAGSPNAPTGSAPLFRTFNPTTNPSRTFPRLTSLISNTQTRGEILPSYGRRLTFRLVARDNRASGGGVDYDSMQVVAVPTAGPFTVTAPNVATTWLRNAPQQVTWSVANTNQAPINATNVNILLSTDGGLTYPTTLAANTPNDGCEAVTLPTGVSATTGARIRVQASGGIFFDISNENFTIEAPTGPTFFLQGPGCGAAPLAFCPGSSATQPVAVGQLQAFAGTVALSATGLPAGVAVSYATASIPAGSSTTATFSASSAAAAGTYTVRLTGTSGGVVRVQDVVLTILSSATQAASITAPTAGSTTTLRPRITWAAVVGATSYEVQFASDAAFSNILLTQAGVASPLFTYPSTLQPSTTYYVRVRALSPCSTAPYSATVAFVTGAQTCQSVAATQVPRTIAASTASTITSVINVDNAEQVSDVRIRNLTITHSNVSELEITLTNPAGRRVLVFPRACPGTADVSLSFDDTAPALACPLVSGTTVRPAESFSSLLNDAATGNWTLTITDNAAGNGGTLTAWTLELCTLGTLPAPPTSLTTFPRSPSGASRGIDLLWIDASGNESGFEIERAQTGTSAFSRIATVPVNTTFYTDALTSNGTYCYRVRAINPTGPSAYSNESCQTISTITSLQNTALLEGVEVYPNPGAGLFTVKVSNEQRGTIRLRVTDALGRTISNQALTKSAAPWQHQVDLSTLSQGVYMLHLDMPTSSAVVRLLKQ